MKDDPSGHGRLYEMLEQRMKSYPLEPLSVSSNPSFPPIISTPQRTIRVRGEELDRNAAFASDIARSLSCDQLKPSSSDPELENMKESHAIVDEISSSGTKTGVNRRSSREMVF